MINIYIVLVIIIWHFIADFVLQTEYDAVNKSSSFGALLSHTITYSGSWILITLPYVAYNKVNPINAILFMIITFICHTITDYFTSRLNKKLAPKSTNLRFDNNYWGNKEGIFYPKDAKWHNFFVGVGFDQVLHYIQLFLTYFLLS